VGACGNLRVMPAESVDALLNPLFVAGLNDLPMAEVRHRRDIADEVETGVSYLRRLLQGRADIVGAEQQRRLAGEAPGDLSDLVDRLPYILGDNVHAPGVGRLPTLIAPGEMDAKLQSRLDAIVSTRELADLPRASDAELATIAADLQEFESEVSKTRRALHSVLDRLKEEIVRRYRTGEANVDDLLTS
jgi:hypothetical protein